MSRTQPSARPSPYEPLIRSAGILVFRRSADAPEFLLGRHGGPFWIGRSEGGWTIPKGQLEPGEDAETAARREFLEETGLALSAPLTPLGEVRSSRKVIDAYLAEADLDLAGFVSNTFELEWPKWSGRISVHPELERVAYCTAADAVRLLAKSQRPLIQRALDLIG